MKRLTKTQIRTFRRHVYGHYRLHGRHTLPWRQTTDPYCIFVSEVMLQQTPVRRVVPKYREFLERFPSWEALADAPLRDILRTWQGLGYNRRARFLSEAARMVVKEYGGVLPTDPKKLSTLPGVGRVSAASIAAFAFNIPTIFVETNIRSVFIYHFFAGNRKVTDSQIIPLIVQTLDRRNPARWYSALMDYGSDLKRRVGNPNRRSRHYNHQTPFEGSDRQVRGQILRELLRETVMDQETLFSRVGGKRKRVRRILHQMITEGLLQCVGGKVEVASK